MATIEEPTGQQMNAMQTDVVEFQHALQGPAQRCAELVIQLVINESRVNRVVEAGDEATAVMSRLQAVETCGASATTRTAQRKVREQGSDRLQAARVELREEQRVAHSMQRGTAELGL